MEIYLYDKTVIICPAIGQSVAYESKKYTLLILNIINTHSIKLNMRAVEYCTMNVLKHKWHFWCIKLRVIVHNLLSSTIKLNGL